MKAITLGPSAGRVLCDAPGVAETVTMDEAAAVRSMAALAQPARLRVFRALVGAGPAGLHPGGLSASLDIPASTLSFHLKELVSAGLVSQTRHGRHLVYRPEIGRMNGLIAYLGAHCCEASLDCEPGSHAAVAGLPASPCRGC